LARRGRGGVGGGKEEKERRRAEKRNGEGGGIMRLTLNLFAFSLRVSLIYIRGVTIANGFSPWNLIYNNWAYCPSLL